LHFEENSVTIIAWIMGAELYAVFCVQSCPYPDISLLKEFLRNEKEADRAEEYL
jgi:hypothetical protein